MLSYREITPHVFIVLEGSPYEVVASRVVKKQRQKPTNQTRLRNLITGSVVEKTFHQSDAVEEAVVEKYDVVYLYTHQAVSWFSAPDNPKDRFSLPETLVKEKLPYLKEHTTVVAHYFDGKVVGIEIPVKVDLKVSQAPPAIRGNTAQGGTKQVVLETGLSVSVPLFIAEGDSIRINTQTGQYVERSEKQ